MTVDHRMLNEWASKAHHGLALVVGSRLYPGTEDRRSLYRDAIGLDIQPGDGVNYVHDLEEPLPAEYKFGHVDCCSVLEHVRRPWLMAQNIEAALVPGGTLLVSVPFVWRLHDYPGDYWRVTPEGLGVLFPRIEWVDRFFLTAGKRTKVLRTLDDGQRVWHARTETVGFGYLHE